MTKSKTLNSIISGILKIIVIILIVGLANIVTFFINNTTAVKIASFLNSNLILLISISILFFIGEVIYSLKFPLDLASPPFDAIAAVFVVNFLIKLLFLLDSLVYTGISTLAKTFETPIYILVFLITLIACYVKVLSTAVRRKAPRKEEIKEEREKDYEEENKNQKSKKSKKRR